MKTLTILMDSRGTKDLETYLLTVNGVKDINIKNENDLEITINYNSNIISAKTIKMEIDLFFNNKTASLLAFDKHAGIKTKRYQITKTDICCEYCFRGMIDELFETDGVEKVESNFDIEKYNYGDPITITIDYDPNIIKDKDLKRLIESSDDTTIYLIRHSKPLEVNYTDTKDNLQCQNEKKPLSIEGEVIAKEKLNLDIFNNIDIVYSSNYVRAISTAKYLAERNHLEINIMDDLGERKFGITSWKEKPKDFERKQFLDENYKIGEGESQKEVKERMTSAITKIQNENKGKNIAIFTHGTAISYLLKNWCDIKIIEDKLNYSYKGKEILNGHFDYCEIIKLDFDDHNKIKNIERIAR